VLWFPEINNFLLFAQRAQTDGIVDLGVPELRRRLRLFDLERRGLSVIQRARRFLHRVDTLDHRGHVESLLLSFEFVLLLSYLASLAN